VAATTEITDQRASQPITVELVKYFAARDGDYEGLRARSTTKEDVDLGNLPNAKSDDPGTDSSDILATTKALSALRKLVDSAQVGLIGSFAMITPPDGWLRANGAAVSRTVYAALFAKIGTTYGAGDGVSTFNLPDPRGKFVRALDDGRGLDAGRGLGSSQADDTRSHSHTGSSGAAGGHSHTGGSGAAGSHAHTASADVQGNHSHTVNNASSSGGVYGSWYYADTGIGADQPSNVVNEAGNHSHNITVNGVGDHAHAITINAVGDHSHAITINATGGSETRPTNIAFLACIKY
jgi:microcystin-dependent protein